MQSEEESEEEEYTPTKRPGVTTRRAPPVRRLQRQGKATCTAPLFPKLLVAKR